jgi:hypothetical protein
MARDIGARTGRAQRERRADYRNVRTNLFLCAGSTRMSARLTDRLTSIGTRSAHTPPVAAIGSAVAIEPPEEPSGARQPFRDVSLKCLERGFIWKLVMLAQQARSRDDHRVTVWTLDPDAFTAFDEQPGRHGHAEQYSAIHRLAQFCPGAPGRTR